jgi:hypothetical protein
MIEPPRPRVEMNGRSGLRSFGCSASLMRSFPISLAVAAVLFATLVASPTASARERPRLFAANSVWNAPLKASASLDPTSSRRMAAFRAEVASEVSHATGPWISETSYSTPVYTVAARQPRVRVKLDTGPWGASLQTVLNRGVPIPGNARPANGTDGHLTIWQPSSDTLW